jgi:hypothetical protein
MTELSRLAPIKEKHFLLGKSLESSRFISTSDCESEIYEDSGTFCDSDSGISSLYEPIIKYQSLTGKISNRNSFILLENIEENDLELDKKICPQEIILRN